MKIRALCRGVGGGQTQKVNFLVTSPIRKGGGEEFARGVAFVRDMFGDASGIEGGREKRAVQKKGHKKRIREGGGRPG